jgi:inorganic triphosphatase YgiF
MLCGTGSNRVGTELEAKYRLETQAQGQILLHLPQLGGYRLEPAAPELQHNRYYDTADGRLQQHRYGLRIRQIGAQSIVTLKGDSRSTVAGISERAEYEVEATQPDPHTWPASPARTHALALIGDAPLIELLRISTERQHIYVWREQQRVAEISLDHGTTYAGDLHEPFDELEIELLPDGSRADLDALIAALAAHLPLQPEPRSKLARGLALLAQSAQSAQPAPTPPLPTPR